VRPARPGAACDTLAVEGLSGENPARNEVRTRAVLEWPLVSARVPFGSTSLQAILGWELGRRARGNTSYRTEGQPLSGRGARSPGPRPREPRRVAKSGPRGAAPARSPWATRPTRSVRVSMSSRSHQERPAAQRGMDARDLASPCTAGELPGRLPRLGRRPVGGTSLVRTVEGRVRVLPLLRARRSVAVLARNPGHCPGGSSVIGAAARGDAGSP
jgi:hypothetical protein